MDTGFIDLDILVSKVRSPSSRAYFLDAVRAYKAGTFRPAITAIWVAVVFDIIEKYRELSAAGDAEAQRFLKEWDAARTGGDVDKLLKLERGILEHAHNKFELIDSAALRNFNRLKEDRNYSAHPAYSNEVQLFEPSPELVKLHLVNAIELLLSQRPVQGRGVFEEFSKDLVSPGFPSSSYSVANYLEQKYLSRMRQVTVKNLASILAKFILRGVPEEWKVARTKVAFSLRAIQQRRGDVWAEIETDLIRIIDDVSPADRMNALPLLAMFPNLIPRIRDSTIVAIKETLSNVDAVKSLPPASFTAVKIEMFREKVVKAFSSLSDEAAVAVLQEAPSLWFWPEAVGRYKAAKSFRSAEALFQMYILPFQSLVAVEQLDELIDAIGSNGQIYDASGTPDLLAEWLRGGTFARPTDGALNRLVEKLKSTKYIYRRFSEVWDLMEGQGWARPEVVFSEDDDIPF